MKIKVTAEDIARGFRRKPSLCPVALASRRAFNSLTVSVGLNVAGNFVVQDYSTPNFRECEIRDARINAIICAYDDGDGMDPFEFEVEA